MKDATIQGASGEEDEKIGEIPAIFANKVYISKLPTGTKITFAENFQVAGSGTKIQPRVSVFLQYQDTKALHLLLGSTLKDVKIEVKLQNHPKQG